MKDKPLHFLSLTISIVAVFYATWIHQHAELSAEQALQKRERQFVQKFAPKVRELYQELGVTNIVNNPTTLDELFVPYLENLNRILTSPADEEKKSP